MIFKPHVYFQNLKGGRLRGTGSYLFFLETKYLTNNNHRSLIQDLTQTAVIYMYCITMHFNVELDVSYASVHTFLKVIVTMFENYILQM